MQLQQRETGTYCSHRVEGGDDEEDEWKLRTYCSRIGRHIDLHLYRTMQGCDHHSSAEEDRDTHHSPRRDMGLWLILLLDRIDRCGYSYAAGEEEEGRIAPGKTPLLLRYFSV